MKQLKKGIWQISDASIGLGVGLFCFALIVIPLVTAFHKDQQYSTAASHALRVEKATHKYMMDNALRIGNRATATSPYILGVPELIQAGYLPSGFSETNLFSQRYHTRIVQPAPLKFHHMIFLTGGAPLSLSAARKMAMRIGGSGGYIEGGLAKGVMGGWTEPLSAFGGYHPGEGHVVIAGFFSQGSGKNDYLYRHAVPGQAELNTMKTALNMEGNDINAVNQLNANKVKTKELHATGSAHIEGALRSGGDMTTDGWLITQGSKGWYSSEGEGGWHMTDKTWIKAINGKSIYTSGTVLGGYVKLDNISVAGAKCNENGLLSRDASGAILSCQSGVWKGAGGGHLSRAGVNALSVKSTGDFHFVLVSISSRFFAVDGSHTAMANFTLSLNGRVREQITNGLNVRKTGGGGHYWGYDTVGVVQKQYRLKIAQGDHLRVALSSAHYHLSSDIRIDLSN
ncbi:shufflon system plasmid conjugative transfer pilus tip adhesin PilV [Candidatus Williamhamiltonella defendens]|uniref:Pilus assembly protein PilV n=1 Tax=Candidatus Williamhamiltonella defendens TaxID=138072 RepID=A0A2D3TEF7_9ENTR|nr:shufflon system plasmid conjugative transfer pilus tip adhesin PilV [Candidatus Hamiltonella defensa]ATW34206.1 pilus assembly protein PilV [Candidatus Hamiltonella defensa]